MEPLSFESISTDEIFLPEYRSIKLAVLRLDKLHDIISGNKWFKLKYYLEDAKANQKDHLVTFGGAFSNHIVAVAAAGKLYGYKTTGVIRGEQPAELSPTLQDAKEFEMQLLFISREDYRDKKLPFGLEPNQYLIAEGGYGALGMKGATEILDYCEKDNFSHICCAVGTSTMMAGLINAALPEQEIIGISALKNNMELQDQLLQLLSPPDKEKNFRIIHDYHFGGYAKYTPALIDFMKMIYGTAHIRTDFIYTAKLFYGIIDMIKKGDFSPGSNILLIHSGGLQGNRSISIV